MFLNVVANLKIAVSQASPLFATQAQQLAEALQLPHVPYGAATHPSFQRKLESKRALCAKATQLRVDPVVKLRDDDFNFLLIYTEQHLELRQLGNDAPGPIFVDFVTGKARHRRLYGGGKNQLLAKACGIKGSERPRVIDATAGLGRDAFALACLGCEVILLERSPIIAALLRDGLQRLQAESSLVNLKMQLIETSAVEYLAQHQAKVIYLDPMHPSRDKTAAVKKEMRMLREVVGADEDAAALLTAAQASGSQRIVVKRPRLAEALGGGEPRLCFKGKSTRYDVYLGFV